MRKTRKSKLNYLISLPERLLRAIAAATGGFLYEALEVLLPVWIRRSRLYHVLVYRLLRITVELVGGVHGVFSQDEIAVQELAKRKAAGNVIELASFLAVGWSPLWLLAAAADLTGGTRVYLRALVEELKREKFVPESANIATVEDLLNALEASSITAADIVDVPPLNVRELRHSWQILQSNAGKLPNAARLTEIYNQLQQIANQEGRSLFSVSSLIAAGALRAGIQLGNLYIFNYYQEALAAIRQEGFAAYANRISQPYLAAVARHLDAKQLTYTEGLLHRISKAKDEGETQD